MFSADLSRGQRLLLSTVGGVLLAFSLPTVFPIWGKTELLPGGELTFLAYVVMIPLFVALRGASYRAAFFYGFTAGLAYFSVAIWWIDIAMHTFGGIPNYLAVPVLYLLILFLAVHWGAACMLAAWVGDRLRWPLWLLLPPIWTTFELVRNYLFSGYPWGDLGYTLARYRLTVQWASLFGLYGLAFLVVMYNGALYELGRTLLAGDRRAARLPAVVFASSVLLPIAWGAHRVSFIDRELREAPTLKVAVIQPNIDQKIKNVVATSGPAGPMTARDYRSFILQRFLPLTQQADQDGVGLIAWPEASYPDEFPSRPTRLPPLSLPSLNAQLLIGGVTFGVQHGRRTLTNSAFAVGPNLEIVGQYDKHHLVPFGEYVPLEKALHLPIHAVVPDIGFFDPGDSLDVFTLKARVTLPAGGTELRDVRYAPEICYDAIFPEIGVGFSREDPDFLVNLTNDAWYGFSSASYQFLSMVTIRAVEDGKAMVRPANTGISAFIDPAGRIVSRTGIGLVDTESDTVNAENAVPPTMLEGQVPLLREHTPYVVIGDAFAYLCAAFAAGLWLAARRRPHASR